MYEETSPRTSELVYTDADVNLWKTMYYVAELDLVQETVIWISILETSTTLVGAIGIACIVVTEIPDVYCEDPELLIA